MCRAGGTAGAAAWRFPLRQTGLGLSGEQLVEGWNRANDSDALLKLEAHVVSRLRMWRPSIVFTASTDTSGTDPLAHVINQVVLRAVEAAADPSRHAEQITAAGLAPWRTQKIFAGLPAGAEGSVTIDTAQLSARYGSTIGELAAPARGVIACRYVPPVATLGYRLLLDGIPQDVGQRDFFSGIALAPGSEARRMLEPVADSDLSALHREVQRRRNLQAILAQADAADPSDGRFLAGIGEQTRAMRPERAAEVLVQLAERYADTGRWEMAAECFALVVDRYPEHPLAGVALVWLIQYHASGETAWRNRTAEGVASEQVAMQAPPRRDQQLPAATPGEGVHQAAALVAAPQFSRAGGLATNLRADAGERFTKADNYSQQLEQLRPALLAEPRVRFPLAAAHRQLGLPRQAERYFLSVRHGRADDAWRASAETELWLIQPKGEPPKAQCHCVPARDKPRLDGRLDEPMWQAANAVHLRSALFDDGEWPAAVMLAHDDEYLYLGISCTRAPAFAYATSDEPRSRDPDLSGEDRVELLLDIDRDFVTYYRLVIDHCGRTGESCWGDPSWNPTWFVARGESEGVWTAEAAIALAELAGETPVAGKAWALGVQRVVPGVGFQSWTQPAAVEPIGEGFGYLLFR